MQRHFRNLTLLTLITMQLLLGCNSQSINRDYSLDEIEIVSEGVVDKGIKLSYRVPGETLYHSHGAFVVNKNGKIHVTFPRSHIDATKPKVDAPSSTNDDGTLSVIIPVSPTVNQPVEILLAGSESLGSWTITPTE